MKTARLEKILARAEKYLCVIDHYVIVEKWIPYTNQSSALDEEGRTIRKTETTERYEKVWQHAQDFCFYEVDTKHDLAQLKEKIQKLIKQASSAESPEAKNIKFYLIPISDKHLIKHIDFNKKNKDYKGIMHYSNVGVWDCIK